MLAFQSCQAASHLVLTHESLTGHLPGRALAPSSEDGVDGIQQPVEEVSFVVLFLCMDTSTPSVLLILVLEEYALLHQVHVPQRTKFHLAQKEVLWGELISWPLRGPVHEGVGPLHSLLR